MNRLVKLARRSAVLCAILIGVDGAAAPKSSLGRFAVDLAVGWNSDYGLFGAGTRAFLTENWDVHATAGFGAVSSVVGAGTSLYVDGSRTTCWFVFSCRTKWLLKATALKSERGTTSVTTNNVTGRYALNDGYSGSLALEHYVIYGWGFTVGSEVGYRAWWQRPRITLDSGTFDQSAEDRLRRFSADAIEAAITLGWRF